MVEQAILTVLNLITVILPLVMGAQNAQTATAIEKIISALEGILPQIITWSDTIYKVVTNILLTLQNSGTLTPDQVAATQALGAQVDAAWAAVVNQIDPDAPGGDPATKTA